MWIYADSNLKRSKKSYWYGFPPSRQIQPLTKPHPTNGVVNTPIADRRSWNELSGRSVPLTQVARGGNVVTFWAVV